LTDSRNGNLFLDRNHPDLHWYLPDFVLADDLDPSFAFVASQKGQQANGQPYNVARLTLRICKLKPTDVLQFAQANPSATLQEIPLADLTAVLSSFYMDQNGQQQQRTFNAVSLQDMGDSSFLLTFDNSILGDSVVGLYQDLRLFGMAVINLCAPYQAWSKPGAIFPPSNFRLRMMAMPAGTFAAVATSPQPSTPPVNSSFNAARLDRFRPFAPGVVVEGNTIPALVGPPVFVQLGNLLQKLCPWASNIISTAIS
jgi:hypothetical protein